MSKVIKLSDYLVEDAKTNAQAKHRSVPKQIEYWARLGKVAEENPDLPMSFIKDILIGRAQLRSGQKTPYAFGEGK